MATLELREATIVDPAVVRQATERAVELNGTLGDPTRVASRD
jgi:hypothetical protein